MRCPSFFRITSGLFVFVFAIASAASADTFAWEDVYADEALINDGDSFVEQGLRLTFNTDAVSDNDSGAFDLANFSGHAGFFTAEHGSTGAHNGFAMLGFDNVNDDPADYLEFTITFDQAVSFVQFSVLDMDSQAGNGFDDGVEVFYNGAINVRSTPTVYSLPSVAQPTVLVDNELGYEGFEGWNGRNAGPTETIGNIDFDFGTVAVTDITIRYFSTDDAQANPNAQLIGISDISWLPVVPEPGTGMLVALGLVVLGARRRLG